MSRETSGLIVYTRSGHYGRTYHKEKSVNGKIIVHLLTSDYKPQMDDKGQQKKLLCDPSTLTLTGYVD